MGSIFSHRLRGQPALMRRAGEPGRLTQPGRAHHLLQALADASAVVQRLVVLQATWRDSDGNEYHGDPPPGYIRVVDNFRGEYWEPTASYSEDEYDGSSEREGESASEFEPDEDAQAEEMLRDNLDEARFVAPRKDSRKDFWGSGFLENKDVNTRDKLMKRQNFKDNGDGTGSMVSPSGTVMKLKMHKGKWVEDREYSGKPHQPVIDHEVDVLALADVWREAGLSDMSSAEEATFKDFVYNYDPNLRIMPKDEDKGPGNPTYRSASLPKGLKLKGKKVLKAARTDFKNVRGTPYWKKKRDLRRK